MNIQVDKEKNTELIKKKEVKDSPFTIITTENGSFAALGNYQITKQYKTIKQAEDAVTKITWNRITQLISLIIEINRKMNLTKTKEN